MFLKKLTIEFQNFDGRHSQLSLHAIHPLRPSN
jgi:hypothetical protein